MATPASATARRAPARSAPRPAPTAPRRPPLRLFEPAPRPRPGSRVVQRSTMWISGLLVVGSLLAVVVGDALVTQGQVRLSATQQALVIAQANQKTLQLNVASKAAPPVVVSQAKSQGLVAASQVVYLPQVPLNVPLPPPRIAAEPAGTTTTTPSTPPPANATPQAETKAPSTAAPASPAAATTATTTPAGAPTTASTTPSTTASSPATTAAAPQ